MHLNSTRLGRAPAIHEKTAGTVALIIANSLFQWFFFMIYRPYINSRDMSENYVWGSVWSWGNNKHPPMFGWITRLWFDLFPTADWANYLLNEANLGVAFMFLMLALRKIFDEDKTFVALVLTMAVLTIGVPFNFQYNANSAQFPFLAAYAWALMTACSGQRNFYYGLAGAFAGGALLCKYSAALLLAPMTLLIWAYYKPKVADFLPRILLSGVIALAVFSPHLYWSFQHDWPSLHYMQKHATGTISGGHYLAVIADRLRGILANGFVSLLMLGAALILLRPPIWRSANAFSSELPLGLAIFISTVICVFMGALIAQLRPNAEWFIVCMLFFGWALVDVMPQGLRWPSLKANIQLLAIGYAGLLMLFAGYSRATLDHSHPPLSALPELLARDITVSYHETYHKPVAYAAGSYPLAYDMAFYSVDHPYGVYQSDVPGSPWIDPKEFAKGTKVVICSTEKRDYVKDPECSQQAIQNFGPPDHKQVFSYEAYDPRKKTVRSVKYNVLMYR